MLGIGVIEKWVVAYNNKDDNNTATPSTMRASMLTIQAKTTTGVAIDPQSGDTQPCDELRISFETILRRIPEGQERDVM